MHTLLTIYNAQQDIINKIEHGEYSNGKRIIKIPNHLKVKELSKDEFPLLFELHGIPTVDKGSINKDKNENAEELDTKIKTM